MTINVTVTRDCDGCSNLATTAWILRGGANSTPQGVREGGNPATGWVVFDENTPQRRDFCPECVKLGRAK